MNERNSADHRMIDSGRRFHEYFRTNAPDKAFPGSWSSSDPLQVHQAMMKAKQWLDNHPGKTVLDAAKIISSLLRADRHSARLKAEYQRAEAKNKQETQHEKR